MKAIDARHFLLTVRLRREAVPSFEQYPFCLGVVRHLDEIELHPAVTFLVGENGSGKSTLLEAIAVAWGFNPEGGSRHFAFETRGSHSALHRHLTLVRGPSRPRDGYFLRAESFFNVATEIEELDAASDRGDSIIDAYGGLSLHEQSHGESFFALLQNRFRGQGLYVLDEVEAALSPARQMAVLARMHQLVGLGAQFIIATHSPILMAYPDALIYQIGADGPAPVAYRDTDHYAQTKAFLNNPDKYLALLLADSED